MFRPDPDPYKIPGTGSETPSSKQHLTNSFCQIEIMKFFNIGNMKRNNYQRPKPDMNMQLLKTIRHFLTKSTNQKQLNEHVLIGERGNSSFFVPKLFHRI